MRYFVSFFLLCGIVLGAGEVSFPPDSLFRVEELDFKLFAAYPNWKGGSEQNSKTVVFPGESASVSDGFTVRRGKFLLRESETFALEERRKTGRNGAEFKLELTSGAPVNVQMIMVTASIPFATGQGQSFRVNGRRLEFPAYYVSSGRWQIGIPARENRIEIPLRCFETFRKLSSSTSGQSEIQQQTVFIAFDFRTVRRCCDPCRTGVPDGI